MAKKRFPKGIRTHIRKEKSRIHREVLGEKEQKKLIGRLYIRFSRKGFKKKASEKKKANIPSVNISTDSGRQ